MKPLVPFVRSLRVGVVGCVLPSLLSCAGGFSSTTPSVPPPTPSTLAFDSSTNQTGGRPQYSAEDFFQSTSLRAVSFSHDSTRVLLSSDATGIFNSYSQSVTGGAPIALTHSTGDAAWAGRYFPKDDRFLYMADNGGDENQHAYVGLPDGTIKDLTPGDRLKAIFMGFLANDETFFIATNERDPKNFDLYGYSTQQYTRHMVYKNTTGLTLGNVSPNGRWVSLGKVVDNRDSDLFLVEVGTTNELRAITPHEGKANHQSLTFTADSKQLVYRTDAHSDFHQAWTYDLESQAHAPLIQAEWDVMNVKFSKHGRLRASTINQDARTVVSLVDTTTGQPVALPALPSGDIQDVVLSPSETKLVLRISSSRSPGDLYAVDLTKSGEQREALQLSNTLNPKIDGEQLVEAEIVRYPSFDGLPIPAILYRPNGSSSSNRAPAVVWVHGGPGGQTRTEFRPTIQYLVHHGVAVLAVNNRGSGGYGKTFNHLDDLKHGDVDLKDCVWGRKYLESLDWIAGDQVGILGGSYGGYMVLAALAFEPEAFNVGVDIFGVANWVRTLESIPAWWGPFRQALYAELGDPSEDRDKLKAKSPLFHAKNIQRPLLVVQGANDVRVLRVESEEIVAAVKANGVPVEYLVFGDEGHGFVKRKNRITAAKSYLAFLEKHLKR